MRRIVLAAYLVAVGCVANAADLSSPADARALADSAMRLIVDGKVNEAFDLLKTHWPVPSNEIDALVLKTIQQRNVIATRFGESLGHAFISEETVADFAIRYTFAEKRQQHVLRWQFTFYRPEAVWKVNSVTWDDNLGAFFER